MISKLLDSEAVKDRSEKMQHREKDIWINVFGEKEEGTYIVNKQFVLQYVNPVLANDFGPYKGRKCYDYFHNREELCSWCKNVE